MKLSKSKLALAKVINENGGWPQDSEWAVQNGDHGRISFSINKPVRHDSKSWMAKGGFNFKIEVCKPLKNWHQCVLNREEYYQAYPKADADGWIEWNGGECPVEKGLMVDIRVRNGREERNLAANTLTKGRIPDASCAFWKNDGMAGDIIAYRLHTPDVKPEFCESVMRSIPDPESKPTIEQLAADYRNAKDYAERKQQEADDAKVDADSKLKALELAGEAIGLTVSPITERQAPELVITDWRQWRVGDVVSWSLLNHAVEFEIISVHHDQSRNIGDFDVKDKQGGVYRVYGNECRFIRRP